MYYVAITINIKRKYPDRLYEINKEQVKATWIDTNDLLSLKNQNSIIILHANDVRLNSDLRNKIISHGRDLGWTFHLFTNDDSPGTPLRDFAPNSSVFRWSTIEDNFPDLPPKVKENLVSVYLLCKGYLAGLDRINSLEKAKKWWQFVENTDFGAEITALGKSPEGDRVEKLLKELKDELKKGNMDLSKIVTPLEKELATIEQNGRFL